MTGHRTGRRVAALGMLVLALALVIIAGWKAQVLAAEATARTEALAAAKKRVPALLSYENATLGADLDQAAAQTTGPFSDDYRKVLTDLVEPTAGKQGISTTASVSAAGVVSGDRDRVVVLVFLTQTTTAKGGRSSVSGSRVEVTLEPVGSGWKIAGLKPV